nr:MAG TPA: hypothetical protein [Caudoviricetes sp.]
MKTYFRNFTSYAPVPQIYGIIYMTATLYP